MVHFVAAEAIRYCARQARSLAQEAVARWHIARLKSEEHRLVAGRAADGMKAWRRKARAHGRNRQLYRNRRARLFCHAASIKR